MVKKICDNDISTIFWKSHDISITIYRRYDTLRADHGDDDGWQWCEWLPFRSCPWSFHQRSPSEILWPRASCQLYNNLNLKFLINFPTCVLWRRRTIPSPLSPWSPPRLIHWPGEEGVGELVGGRQGAGICHCGPVSGRWALASAAVRMSSHSPAQQTLRSGSRASGVSAVPLC